MERSNECCRWQHFIIWIACLLKKFRRVSSFFPDLYQDIFHPSENFSGSLGVRHPHWIGRRNRRHDLKRHVYRVWNSRHLENPDRQRFHAERRSEHFVDTGARNLATFMHEYLNTTGWLRPNRRSDETPLGSRRRRREARLLHRVHRNAGSRYWWAMRC